MALSRFVAARLSRQGRLGLYLTVGLLTALTALWLFVDLTEDVLSGETITRWDLALVGTLRHGSTPTADAVFLAVALLGSPGVMGALGVVGAVGLAVRRDGVARRPAGLAESAVPVSAGVVTGFGASRASAPATPVPPTVTAAPIPRAIAKEPTRPTCSAAFTATPFAHGHFIGLHSKLLYGLRSAGPGVQRGRGLWARDDIVPDDTSESHPTQSGFQTSGISRRTCDSGKSVRLPIHVLNRIIEHNRVDQPRKADPRLWFAELTIRVKK